VPEAELAPPTGLTDLADLMHCARAVVSCDTGPMHLAVAVGTPTCGVFVSTDPSRYGYAEAPNLVLDVRSAPLDVGPVEQWLRGLPD
jgi:ADP-heptose:LPS heptosyltransferase